MKMRYLFIFLIFSNFCHAANLISISSFTQGTDEQYLRLAFDEQINQAQIEVINSYRLVSFILPSIQTKIKDGKIEIDSIDANIQSLLWGIRLEINLEEVAEHDFKIVNSLVLIRLKKETKTDINSSASVLLEKAKNNPDQAKSFLYQIQMMPTNDIQDKAHLMLIDTLIDQGDLDHAKAQLKLYLDLYPNAPDIMKQRHRLIELEIAAPDSVSNRKAKPRTFEGTEMSASGSISYYHISGFTDNKKDQNLDVASVNLQGKYREDSIFTRTNIRYNQVVDYLHPENSKYIFNTATVEIEDKMLGWSTKLGRQYPVYGVLGRFDGISTQLNTDNGNSLIFVAGTPWSGPTESDRKFWGIGWKIAFDEPIFIVGYLNTQTADNILERKAIGLDVRSNYNNIMFNTAIEYDLVYRAFNAISIQSRIDMGWGATFHMYYDQRKYPVMYGDRALSLGFNRPEMMAYKSVGEAWAKSGLGSSEIYNFIEQSTPTGTIEVIGLSKSWNDKIRVYGDLQKTNISSAKDPTFIPTILIPESRLDTPASGVAITKNLNVTVTNVYSKHDENTVVFSHTKDQYSLSNAITLLFSKELGDVRADLIGRWTTRNDTSGQTNSIMETLRFTYKILNNVNAELQYTTTTSKTTAISSIDNTSGSITGRYLIMGVRINF